MQFSKPSITEYEIEAVSSCIREGHLSTGVKSQEFEETFKTMFGYQYTASVNSGTSALSLALIALGVGQGDEVITSAYGISCTVNAIISTGAKPVFADIDRNTYNIKPECIVEKINNKTKAILPTSLFGVPCDIPAIKKITSLPIIEDSIECLGSIRNNEYIGSDVDVAVFGFYPNKQITTCQGGMVVSNNRPDLVDKIRKLSRHGYGNTPTLWNPSYGFNLRLPDPLAAMGIVQLNRMWDIQKTLSNVVDLYDEFFYQYRTQLREWEGTSSTNFIYGIEVPYGLDKRKFEKDMSLLGVPVRPYFNDISKMSHCYSHEIYPVTQEVSARTVALPFHCEITKEDVYMVAQAYENVIQSSLLSRRKL